MNVIWTTIVIVCLGVLAYVNPNLVLPLCVNSATQALEYAFQLVGVYALWLGVFAIAEKCNFVQKLSQKLQNVIKLLFGYVSPKAREYLCLNVSSNLLGVGNAATPSGISAMTEMEQGKSLTKAGAMLFVLNANGIQLVPTTVIGLRASLGSNSATDIVFPTLICTLVTSFLGVFLVNLAFGEHK